MKRNKRLKIVLIILVCILVVVIVLPVSGNSTPTDNRPSSFRVMSWNVENLFDTQHDESKNDREFLPDSKKQWTNTRYKKKLNDIARVITADDMWNPPALIALCEVENDAVMQDLTRHSSLKKLKYRYVMTESSDPRGIDVALLYQQQVFTLLSARSIPIARNTRDLLHVSGRLPTGDTLDVIIGHFTSRRNGVKDTEPKRIRAAGKVRTTADSLMNVRQHPLLIIMGDFNDYPTDRSIHDVLEAEAPDANEELLSRKLYHLLARKAEARDFGSYKYRGHWGLLDHLIVSGTLLDPSSSLHTSEEHADVLRSSLLIKDDKPFSTYKGDKYQGGISDHLPVYADFELATQ